MKYFLFLSSIVFFSWTSNNLQKSLRVTGSDTCLPVLQNVSEQYMKAYPSASVTVTGGGSGVGITALMAGTTDITMASRRMKMDEKLNMQQGRNPFKEIVFAYDALSVIVHPGNVINQLTMEQLEGIFTGKITNWKELGGEDLNIIIYSRETSSGTYEFFKDKVLGNKNFASSALMLPATGGIIRSISQTKGAIGYAGLAYVDKNVKALRISFDEGKTYISGTKENGKNKTYLITRPLYLYYTLNNENKVKHYIDYILSKKGQGIIDNQGYIKMK